jgi:hypothetical protein
MLLIFFVKKTKHGFNINEYIVKKKLESMWCDSWLCTGATKVNQYTKTITLEVRTKNNNHMY